MLGVLAHFISSGGQLNHLSYFSQPIHERHRANIIRFVSQLLETTSVHHSGENITRTGLLVGSSEERKRKLKVPVAGSDGVAVNVA